MSREWNAAPTRGPRSSFMFVRPKGSLKRDLIHSRDSLDGTKRRVENTTPGRSATFYRDWPSNLQLTTERGHLTRGHPFYQSDRPKEPWHPKDKISLNKTGRRLSYQEDPRPLRSMVTQENKDDERPASAAEEPPPPPQPPYHMPVEEPRGRLDRGERRSIRKLTKDSGYETSQYADSDYANVDWEQSSDRSPTSKSTRSPSSDWSAISDHEFPVTNNYDRFHPRNNDTWRGAYNKSNYHSFKSNHKGVSVHQWDPPISWRPSRNDSSSVRTHNSTHLRNASSSSSTCVSPVRRGTISDALARYSSTDSLNSASSSSVSFPPASSSGVSSAKSTPSLLLHQRDEETLPRCANRSRAATTPHMSNSSPSLEKDSDVMVTRRTHKTRYESRPCGAVYMTNAVSHAAHFWPEEESENFALRSMGVAVYQHTRQVSSQSSGSERTSSSYSQHSRQVSSQSSFSEDDFRIQSIKEEFHQRNGNCDCFPPPPPPYPSKYYSADNLVNYDQEGQWNQLDTEAEVSKEPPFPPPPPIRDASSLKYNSRHEHEKFPSWPVMVGGHSEACGQAMSIDYDQRRRKGFHQITSAAYEYEYYYTDPGSSSDHKKERPPSYEDGPPPPYSPYWSSTEEVVNESLRGTSGNGGGEKTATPLLDRLRLETQQRTPTTSGTSNWNGKEEQRAGHPYNGRDSVTSSTSSQETLKWHGSTSDLSVQSERTRNQKSNATEPVTVHSAKVQQPQRHHSESVLYYGNKPQSPVRVTSEEMMITEQTCAWAEQVRKNNAFNAGSSTRRPTHAHPLVAPHPEAVAREEIRKMPTPEFAKPLTSVAQRIQHLERLSARANNCQINFNKKCKQIDVQLCPRKQSLDTALSSTEDRKLYLDPEKKHRVSDPELKAIQKQAVLSFFERQTNSQKRTQIASQSLPRNYNNSQEDSKKNINRRGIQNDARVAIYYNTFTQTQITGEDQTPKEKKGNQGNAICNAGSMRECQVKHEVDVESSPRRDIALQTEWSFGRSNEVDYHHQKSPSRNADVCIRESGTLRNPRPPERPPKRPHLQHSAPVSDPPPLLPRASPSVASARAVVVVPVTPPPDEDAEDQELLRIEESARQLRNLDPPPSTIARPPPPCVDLINSRGSTPDLPLPPPPPLEINHENEDGHGDDPLPPPPTPGEVKRIIQQSTPESDDSSVSESNKDRFMALKNERQQNRQGFDGTQNRTSPERNTEMESSPPPLTPSGWEKWHKIGRPGATVVFKSCDMKPSGALKVLNNEQETRAKKEEEPRKVVSSRRTVSDASTCYNNKREVNIADNQLVTKENLNCNLQNGWRSSADSLTYPRGTSRFHPETEVDRVISSRTTKQGPTPSSVEDDSSSTCSSSSSARTPTDFAQDLRKSCSTQTQTQNQTQTQTQPEIQPQKQVEVTTQTTPSVRRTRRQEEVECDLLSKDLARQLPKEEKALQALLTPCQLKTTADYMQGLFPSPPSNTRSTNRVKTENNVNNNSNSDFNKRSPEVGVLPADSAYFTTSESKARFLTRYSKDMNQAKVMDVNTAELGKKKEDLVTSISRKLEILRSEQLAIQDEINANEELGRSVTSRVEKLAKSNELDKYKLHVEEIDKITSLLLGLSGRLARAENALMGLTEESSREDREITRAKRDKLFDQHEEAKRLKENIDRRSEQVSNFLHKYLSREEYEDYDHFVRMKSKLLIDCKEIDDKIKLGEEQMLALKNNLGKWS